MFAFLFSSRRGREDDLSKQFSPEEAAAIVKNLTDPAQLMTVEEMLAHLDAEDDRKTATE